MKRFQLHIFHSNVIKIHDVFWLVRTT